MGLIQVKRPLLGETPGDMRTGGGFKSPRAHVLQLQNPGGTAQRCSPGLMIPLMWISSLLRPEASYRSSMPGGGALQLKMPRGRVAAGMGAARLASWGLGIMKDKINRVLMANPGALIVLGMVMIGCSMVAFAALRWPTAFYGILGTFVP